METKHSMDIRKIINELKLCTDKRIAYKLLLKVRTDFISKSDDIKKFTELGGVPILIHHLKRPIESNLDVALSALGNICMYKEGAISGLENNILSSLNSILSSVTSKSIKLRCVRLLGNLAQHMNKTSAHSETSFKIMLNNLCNEFDEILGSESIDENINYIAMLIRTVRNLWKNRQASNTFMMRGVIKKVMIILWCCFEHPNIATTEDTPSVIPLGATVILKRGTSPDRVVTREKFLTLINDIDNHKNSDIIGYEPVRDATNVNLHDCQVKDTKDVKNLLSGILKLLEVATNNASISIVTQVLSCPSSNQCFVSLIDSDDISVVLKIIAALVTFQIAKQILTTLDVVTHVSSYAMDESCSSKDLFNSIKILCNLTVDACNRGKLRRSGVFSKLIKICNESTKDEETEMILVAFYQFRFDHLSLDNLLKEGIILMLIRLLQRNLKEKKYELKHEPSKSTEKEQTKNKRKQDVEEGSLPKPKSIRESSPDIILNFSNKYLTAQNVYASPFMRSPSPFRDPGSPASSSGYSSANIQDSPNYTYSPVCSDSEDEDAKIENETKEPETQEETPEESQEIFDISSLMQDDCSVASASSEQGENTETKSPEKATSSVIDTKFDLVECVLKLMLELSKRNATHPDFVRVSTLDTLLNVYSKVETAQKDVVPVLNKVLKQIHNFIPVLKQNFIFKLYESRRLPNCAENCTSCTAMECQVNDLLIAMGENAQSGYGIGELAHFLLRGESDLKLQAAIITMYLIKCNKSLYKLLFVHNALDIVLNLIFNDAANKMMANYACTGFTVMAHNLNITVVCANDEFETSDRTAVDYDETKDYKLQVGSKEDNCVTFIVENNEKIEFNRELLMQTSDFFDTMFKSDFKEAQENTVKLTNISAVGLKYFLLLISETIIEKSTAIHVNRNMKSCLEAYGLAKLYLLSELEKLLLTIVKKVINHTNIITVVEYSFKNFNSDLLSISINYYLNSGYITGDAKRNMFNEANSSTYQKQWLERLKDTILLQVNYGE